MKVVKLESLQGEFRTKGRFKKGPSELVRNIADLQYGEALVISAKEADKWKYPTNSLRATIDVAKKSKYIAKTAKYSVYTLKSGSYAVSRISK